MLLWCHKRLRFMVHFTRACKTLLSENNKTRLTFEKQQEKNKNIICRPWSVRIEKNCALGLEHGPRPAASGRTQDLWHSFSQYGPPGRQIIYIYSPSVRLRCVPAIRDFISQVPKSCKRSKSPFRSLFQSSHEQFCHPAFLPLDSFLLLDGGCVLTFAGLMSCKLSFPSFFLCWI